jgi:hypothetical protein
MKPADDKPLRGEAAWRAEKERIAARNDAARARGAAERQAHEARQAEQRHIAARLERASRPKPQP